MEPELLWDSRPGAAVQETSHALVLFGVSILLKVFSVHIWVFSQSQPGTETLRFLSGPSRSAVRTELKEAMVHLDLPAAPHVSEQKDQQVFEWREFLQKSDRF